MANLFASPTVPLTKPLPLGRTKAGLRSKRLISSLDPAASRSLTSQTGRCRASPAAGGHAGATAGTCSRSYQGRCRPQSSLSGSRSPGPPAPLERRGPGTAAGPGPGDQEAVRAGAAPGASLRFLPDPRDSRRPKCEPRSRSRVVGTGGKAPTSASWKKCSRATFPYLSVVRDHEKLHELLRACAAFGFLMRGGG